MKMSQSVLRMYIFLCFKRTLQAALLVAVVACGGGGGANPVTTATVDDPVKPPTPPSTSAVTQTVTTAGTVALTDQMVVLKTEKVVAGKTDYVLSPIYCNKGAAQADQTLKLSYTDATAAVVQDTVQLGSSSFGQCKLKTNSTATVRIPDSQQLDYSKINISISGQVQLNENPIKMIKVELYTILGRGGHQQLFPLNTQFPTKGEIVLLKAGLVGSGLSAKYFIKNSDGIVLTTGELKKVNNDYSNDFKAVITVPISDFKVEINAVDKDGQIFKWNTDLYQPQIAQLNFDLKNGAINLPGQKFQAVINGIASEAGDLILRVNLPDGYTSDWINKKLTVANGEKISTTLNIVAPQNLSSGRYPIFLQYKYPTGQEVLKFSRLIVAANN